jgi:hypothetical protein
MSVVDLTTIQWEKERKAAAKLSREANRRRDEAIDGFLHLLRQWKPSAYRCDANDPDAWFADCPCCLDDNRPLTVRQTGSRVSLRCRSRCTEADILAALQQPSTACAHCAEWQGIALEAQDITRELHDLCAWAVATHVEAVAA